MHELKRVALIQKVYYQKIYLAKGWQVFVSGAHGALIKISGLYPQYTTKIFREGLFGPTHDGQKNIAQRTWVKISYGACWHDNPAAKSSAWTGNLILSCKWQIFGTIYWDY